jgi:hypothetical protein
MGSAIEQWLPNAIQAGTAVGQLYIGLTGRRQQQAADWGELLKDLAGLDGRELRRIVEDNPAVAELVGIAWEAAARTASEDKRYLLAQVAAAALRGDSTPEQIDRLQFLLRPVIALDSPHITLLVLIPEFVDISGQNPPNPAEQQVGFPDLAAKWQGGERLLGPAIAALEGQGLIEVIRDHGGSARWCKLRPFGSEFLDYLLIDAGGWPPRQQSERQG